MSPPVPVIETVVELSDRLHFLRLIGESVLLYNSIHSGSPDDGAYIISLTMISL